MVNVKIEWHFCAILLHYNNKTLLIQDSGDMLEMFGEDYEELENGDIVGISDDYLRYFE